MICRHITETYSSRLECLQKLMISSLYGYKDFKIFIKKNENAKAHIIQYD